ncbi:phosphonate ABC transporter, permease protein PhnE [Streptomyces sp. BB1-1-1]|uniref:phosphonate ABC transporter, permease protein PhnE n=1 Tax=Streptomyces sp. BB1-1-1 TaxID=3074430 RepID=UPI0028780523|nr:phosphonate ABC transporter, permease protein PhnE [Streptomyces sp. BB1-1-1]WND33494.1 phosphonate ABC transporter, permease protein PhnE [Streptomyces sp. BB1-1-1]
MRLNLHVLTSPPPPRPPSDRKTDLHPELSSEERPPGRRLLRWTLVAATVLLIAWSVHGTDVGVSSLVAGREGAGRLLNGLFPPDFSTDLLSAVLTATLETLQISITALCLGAVMGLPLAALIAGNVGAPRWCVSGARVVAAFLRGVPELLWALLFVATVGLGPAAGVYAVALHAAGLLAKLCSEQMEAVDPAPVEAMRLTGASRTATMLLAILPQSRSGIISLLLYQWECNIRSSTVVGFVGAGGIGQALGISLSLFRYEELATLLIAVLLLILVVDRISRLLRKPLGAATR